MHWMPAGIVPRALIDELAVERFPARDEFLAVHQWKCRAGNHRNVRAADNFEQAQSVLDFFVAPGVSGDNSDAENVGFGRLDQREYGLRASPARAVAIFVNYDFPFFLSSEWRGSDNRQN